MLATMYNLLIETNFKLVYRTAVKYNDFYYVLFFFFDSVQNELVVSVIVKVKL